MDYIIRKRVDFDNTYYLVKWTGKTHHHNSWLSLPQLQLQPDSHKHLQKFQHNEPKHSTSKIIRKKAGRFKVKPSQISSLKITIPCISKQRRHWVFGDRIQQIVKRGEDGRYLVIWGQGEERWESQEDMFLREKIVADLKKVKLKQWIRRRVGIRDEMIILFEMILNLYKSTVPLHFSTQYHLQYNTTNIKHVHTQKMQQQQHPPTRNEVDEHQQQENEQIECEYEYEQGYEQGYGQSSSHHKYKANIILNPQSTNQILNVIVQPGNNVWYCGEVVASNRPYFNVENKIDNFDFQRFWHFLKMKGKVPMRLNNTGIDIAYFCIRRRGGGGKILVLDSQVYNEKFAIDMSKMLTVNQDPLTFTIQSVPLLNNLSTIHQKQPQAQAQNNPSPPIQICLQSNPGNLIFEKSLGPEEKLYLGSSQILAVSQRIQIKKIENQIVLEGPGFVFLEVPTNLGNGGAQVANFGAFQRIFMLFFLIGLIFVNLIYLE